MVNMTVKIPKEISRRIEELRAIARTNLQIMTEALRPESEFSDYVQLNFDTFSKALTEGYMIKNSPLVLQAR
jgi:predicted transcriptional regulator